MEAVEKIESNGRYDQAAEQQKVGAMTKWVYAFGGGTADGSAEMKNLLGGKGANLAEMSALGLPVPPGFTVTTEVCSYYYDHDGSYPEELQHQMQEALGQIEDIVGARFGDPDNPLLISVRSGARVSMPGMMDTVLNLGAQRRDRRRSGPQQWRPALRVRQLPPLHSDVRRRRARGRPP